MHHDKTNILYILMCTRCKYTSDQFNGLITMTSGGWAERMLSQTDLWVRAFFWTDSFNKHKLLLLGFSRVRALKE